MTRGGKRTPGPGKKLGRPVGSVKKNNKIAISVRLSPDVAKWVRNLPKFIRAAIVEDAIRDKMEIEKK